jgi:hypothetical protein
MAYSAEARALRRCKATTKAGEPCRAWAMWDGGGLCSAHAVAAGQTLARHPRYFVVHANYPRCECDAYRFPHRPGGGDCRWPDPHPARC